MQFTDATVRKIEKVFNRSDLVNTTEDTAMTVSRHDGITFITFWNISVDKVKGIAEALLEEELRAIGILAFVNVHDTYITVESL